MEKELGLKRWDDIPAEKVEEYIVKYAERHDLFRYIRFNTKVLHVEEDMIDYEKGGNGWKLAVQEKGKQVEELRCNKLVLATGLFSTPRMPSIDFKRFNGPVLHSKEVAAHYRLISSSTVERVIVIGGSKSAGEMVNLFASQGKHVTWLIREHGNGPGFMLNPRTKKGVHYSKYGNRRWQGLMGPSILRPEGWWYDFLHSGESKFGSWLVRRYWEAVSRVGIGSVYDADGKRDTKGNMQKITPDIMDLFWGTGGTATYADNVRFMERVREGQFITVHRASIKEMREENAVLRNGIVVDADAVICCTGWKATQSLFSPELCSKLGLPLPASQHPQQTREKWETLDAEADTFVLNKFPMLANPPYPSLSPPAHTKSTTSNSEQLTPFRLYHTLVPTCLTSSPAERNILILGTFLNVSIPIWAEISSLWGVAYMEGLLDLPAFSKQEEMEQEVARQNAWMRWRFRRKEGTGGERNVDVEFLDFVKRLGKELGVETDRRRRGRRRRNDKEGGRKGGLREWYREWMQSYEPSDWAEVVDEFLEQRKVEKTG